MQNKEARVRHLNYPECTMFELIRQTAIQHPTLPAYDFMGKKTTYAQWLLRVERTARALCALGIGAGDCVTICMPNTPQAVDLFYALNRIGAVANVIHPLSAPGEIDFCLRSTDSKAILLLDQFYSRAEPVLTTMKAVKVLVARIADELPQPARFAYTLTAQRTINAPRGEQILSWKKFLSDGAGETLPDAHTDCRKPAVILYSGGTTGTMKGILLSSRSFNALALQTIDASGYPSIVGMKMLAVMPIFHGFGLGVGIHTPLVGGGVCLLVPQFSVKIYADLLKKKKPSFIPGVPTLFEALLRTENLEKTELSYLRGVFCGGDSLSPELKDRVDAFLRAHHAPEQIREGYGATECIAVGCLTPKDSFRRGSIGLPVADTRFCIVRPGTTEVLPPEAEGEICICGPTVMLGYLHQPEETAAALQTHADGERWLHTGDLGKMDADGYVYFIQRLKRMIISSGYNVYPTRIETVLNSHSQVRCSCVVGVPDPYKIQRVKAFVELEPGVVASDALRQELLALCAEKIVRYSLPSALEFCEIPRTKLNKIDFRQLEERGCAGARNNARGAP